MRRYDGIVLFRRHLPVSLAPAVSAGTPVVLLDAPRAGAKRRSVRVDNVDGGYKAAEHLLGMGHRRIACLTGAFGRQETTLGWLDFPRRIGSGRPGRPYPGVGRR